MPKISIITPVLNQVSSIDSCIQSVANQSADVEHIIIDGGSTDGTVDIIKQHEQLLTYWESSKDSGQSEAINKGLSRCSGTFFNWLNADDKLTPNALQTVSNVATTDTNIIIGKCQHITPNGRELAVGSAKIWDSLEATLGNYSMGQPSVFYRTEKVREIGGLNNNLHLCLDMDLWFRFLLNFGQSEIIQTDKVLSYFTVHPSAKSSRLKEEMNAEKYGVYKALFSNFKLPAILKTFFKNYVTPSSISYEIPHDFESKHFIANFSWHLLLDAYQKKDTETCKALLTILKEGSRLSLQDKLMWKTRLASLSILTK